MSPTSPTNPQPELAHTPIHPQGIAVFLFDLPYVTAEVREKIETEILKTQMRQAEIEVATTSLKAPHTALRDWEAHINRCRVKNPSLALESLLAIQEKTPIGSPVWVSSVEKTVEMMRGNNGPWRPLEQKAAIILAYMQAQTKHALEQQAYPSPQIKARLENLSAWLDALPQRTNALRLSKMACI